jgi:hypothetical protein
VKDVLKDVCLSGAAVFGWALVWLMVHSFVEQTADKLWPRGLRWFPGAVLDGTDRAHGLMLRIFWPEKAVTFRPLKVLKLETLDTQWRLWAGVSDGGVPVWRERPGCWEPRETPVRACPCGYGHECAIWCGDGHTTGLCIAHDVTLKDPVLADERVLPVKPYVDGTSEHYRRAYPAGGA